MAKTPETTAMELEPDEVALIIGEDDGQMSVRIIAGVDVPTEGTDLPAAPEIVLALAMRLMKDPDFHDDVLDWYYEHQDDADEEEDEDENENETKAKG